MHFEDIFDKINALLCLGFFWSCFVFSIAYYPLNYAFSPKMERYFSERELISNHGAYFCQAFEKFLRGVLFGIVQGLLIADQISLCVVSGMIKVCVIVICGLKHNHYRIKILFWLLVMYFLLGALYDLFFLLTFIFDNGTTKMGIFLEYVCSKIELMLISGLLLTFLLMFVVSMGYFVYTVWGQLEKYVKRCFKMS